MKKSLPFALLFASLCSAPAAVTTWTGANSAFWNDAGNWSPSLASYNDVLTFGSAGLSGTILTNDIAVNTGFNGIIFNNDAPAYTLEGNQIRLMNASTSLINMSTHVQVLNLPINLANATLTASGFQGLETTGAFGLSKQSLQNNLSGGRVWQISGPVSLSSDVSVANISFSGLGNTRITGSISDSSVGGAAASNITFSSGNTELAAANTYSGNTKISTGATLTLSHAQAMENAHLQMDSVTDTPGGTLRLLADTDTVFLSTGVNLLNVANGGHVGIQVDALTTASGKTLTYESFRNHSGVIVDVRSSSGYTLAVTEWAMANSALLNPISGSVRVDSVLNSVPTLGGSTTGNSIGAITLSSTNQTLTKNGVSTWTLTGVSNYTGSTNVTAGRLILDLDAGASLATSGLNFGGGTFTLKGAASGTSGVTFGSLALNTGRGGASSLTIDQNGGTGTALTFSGGSFFRTTGNTLDLILPSGTQSSTNGYVVSFSNNSAGLLNGNTGMPYATVNGGSDYATKDVGGNIVAYTGYVDIGATGDSITNSTNTNVRINSAGSGGNITLSAATTTVNTLFQNSSTAATVDTSTNTLRLNGILMSPGAAALTIGTAVGSGTLSKPTTQDYVFINNSTSDLTINAALSGGAALLTKAGTGTLILANPTNSFTGRTYLTGGVTQIAADASLGTAPASVTTNQLILNGGTLRWGASFDLATTRGIYIAENGGTFDTNGFNSTYAGVIGPNSNGLGSLTKTGAGTLTLSGANNFIGDTVIEGGTLAYGANDVIAGGDVIVTGTASALDLGASHTDTVGYVTLANGAQINGSGTSTLTSSKGFELKSGNVTAALAGTATYVDVTKTTTDTVTLSGSNTYTGRTLVNSGTLLVNGSHSGGADYIVAAGAVLGGTGSITLATSGSSAIVAPSVSIAGTLAPGNSPGTMDIAGNLVLQQGATYAVQLGGSAPGDGSGFYDQVNMTLASGTLSLEDNVTLDLTTFGGFTASGSDVFYILTRADSGTFSTLFTGTSEGGLISFGGYEGKITYLANWTGTQIGSSLTGGNDVAIYDVIAVPEPATGILWLGGLGVLLWARRRMA